MKIFDEKTLVESLNLLSKESRVAFAASSASRLVAAYENFHQRTGLGNPETIRVALNNVWRGVFGEKDIELQLRTNLEAVMKLVPEENNSWSPLHAYADDAVSAVAYAIRAAVTGDAQEAAWAAKRVYEAVDEYVITQNESFLSGKGSEQEIINDPLIQQELDRQGDDLKALLSSESSKTAPMKAWSDLKSQRKAALPNFG